MLIVYKGPKSTKARQPASTTQALKQEAFHQYLLDSCAPHTLKDLEKHPPNTNPKIRGQEIKDLLNALLADSLVKCEKIGSGNWYWSFASDAVKDSRKRFETTERERKKLENSISELEHQIKQRRAALDTVSGDRGVGDAGKEELEQRRAFLVVENANMTAKIAEHKRNGAGDMRAKRAALPGLIAKAERWEDNMAILEGYIVKLNGGDRSVLQGVRRAVCGEEADAEEPRAKRLKTDGDFEE